MEVNRQCYGFIAFHANHTHTHTRSNTDCTLRTPTPITITAAAAVAAPERCPYGKSFDSSLSTHNARAHHPHDICNQSKWILSIMSRPEQFVARFGPTFWLSAKTQLSYSTKICIERCRLLNIPAWILRFIVGAFHAFFRNRFELPFHLFSIRKCGFDYIGK